ncbi:MAG: sigma-70 family RNA polymerase sigma factor [Clostridia bacterium]|nr:sigma-70 family RNA polymerase sigma factor [Clostridia bacterium]
MHKQIKEHEILILNKPVSTEENNGQEMIDHIVGSIDVEMEVEKSLFLTEAFSLLTPKQRTVVIANILLGISEKEIAKKMKVSQPAVHGHKEKALKKLRKHFTSDKLP